jgi:raffinose/stachyose/melibiose transport system permease protein
LVVPAVLVTLGFSFVAPLIGSVYAFTNWDGFGAAHWVGLHNFQEIFQSSDTRGAIWNTLKLSVVFVVLVNLFGLGLALGVNRVLKSRYLLRSIFFLPVVVIPLATSFVWQYIFAYSGPLNGFLSLVGLHSWVKPWLNDPTWALWTVVVVMLWQYTGLMMVIYIGGLQGIPQELDEAAAIDGATAWRRLRRVTLPLLAPAVTICVVLSTLVALRAFDQIVALTGGGPVNASQTLSTEVYYQTFSNGRYGYGTAIALLLSVIIVAAVLIQMVVFRRREA